MVTRQAPPPAAVKAPVASTYSRPAGTLFPRKASGKPAKEELTRAELRKIKENKSIFGDSVGSTSSIIKRGAGGSAKSTRGAPTLSKNKGANHGKAEISKRFAEEGLRALNKDKRDMRTIDEIDRELQEKRRAREHERLRLERLREVDVSSMLKKPERETLVFAKKGAAIPSQPMEPATPAGRSSSPSKPLKAPPTTSASSLKSPSAASTSKASTSRAPVPSASSASRPKASQPKPVSPAAPVAARRTVPSTARPKARSASLPPAKRPKSSFDSGAPAKPAKKVPSRARERDRDLSSSELDSDSDGYSSGSDRRPGRKRKAGRSSGGGGGDLRSMIWDAMGLDPSKCVKGIVGSCCCACADRALALSAGTRAATSTRIPTTIWKPATAPLRLKSAGVPRLPGSKTSGRSRRRNAARRRRSSERGPALESRGRPIKICFSVLSYDRVTLLFHSLISVSWRVASTTTIAAVIRTHLLTPSSPPRITDFIRISCRHHHHVSPPHEPARRDVIHDPSPVDRPARRQ